MTLPAGQCASICLENDAEEELNKEQIMEDVEQDRSPAQNPEAFLAACPSAELEREIEVHAHDLGLQNAMRKQVSDLELPRMPLALPARSVN